MKKLLLIFALLGTLSLGAQEINLPQSTIMQEGPSYWETDPGQSLTLNYNLLGRHYAQGLFYGAAGYGTGMWLSGNNVWWGIAGSVLATNLPILIDGRIKTPEVALGRNLGMITFSIPVSFTIELHRKGRATYTIKPFLRKSY